MARLTPLRRYRPPLGATQFAAPLMGGMLDQDESPDGSLAPMLPDDEDDSPYPVNRPADSGPQLPKSGQMEGAAKIGPPPMRGGPGAAEDENPDIAGIRRQQAELDALKPPEKPKTNKWQALAAIGLGAAQGVRNAQRPHDAPLHFDESVIHPIYAGQVADYNRKKADIEDRLKTADTAVSTIGKLEAGINRGKDRDDALTTKREQILTNMEAKGIKRIPFGDPLPDGYEEAGHDPLFELGSNKKPAFRTVRNPHFDETQVTAEQAKKFPGLTVGQWVKKKDLDSAIMKPTGGMGQIRKIGPVSKDDAIARQEQGEVFTDANGKILNPHDLPNSMGLYTVMMNGSAVSQPYSLKQRAVNIGGVKYAVDDFNLADTGGDNPHSPVAVGLANPGSSVTSTPTNVVVDTQGAPHVLGSTSQRTPNTPGAFRKPTGAPPSAPAAPPTPTQQPVSRPIVAPSGAGPLPREAKGITVGMDKDFRARATPIRSVATQIFGDPANPDAIPSMRKFAYLADDAATRKRIGDAIRILLANEDHLAIGSQSDSSGWVAGGHAGSGALLPVSVGVSGSKSGSGTQNVQTLSPDQVRKINEQIASVMNQLKPGDERNAVIASIKAYEEIGGLRKAFGGGNALASIKQMQQTLPLIGFNDTNSASSFHTKLTRTAEDAANGRWGIPANYLGQDVIDAIERERRFVPQQSVGGGSGPAASAKISVTAPDGSVHQFDTQAQANNFKALAGIR